MYVYTHTHTHTHTHTQKHTYMFGVGMYVDRYKIYTDTHNTQSIRAHILSITTG